MAITRKESSGIEITEARGDEDVFPCSLPLQEGTSRLEEWRSHEGFPAPRRLTLFSEPHPRRIMALSLWLAFPPLRRWQAPQPLHKLHEGEASGPFTTFHEEVTGAPTKPTRRSPSKSNKLTVSHSN